MPSPANTGVSARARTSSALAPATRADQVPVRTSVGPSVVGCSRTQKPVPVPVRTGTQPASPVSRCSVPPARTRTTSPSAVTETGHGPAGQSTVELLGTVMVARSASRRPYASIAPSTVDATAPSPSNTHGTCENAARSPASRQTGGTSGKRGANPDPEPVRESGTVKPVTPCAAVSTPVNSVASDGGVWQLGAGGRALARAPRARSRATAGS